MKNYITISVFDIFKAGPGPSSSHTIGPMKAAADFLERASSLTLKDNPKNLSIDAFLYGSLSSTGEGHGTHKAVLGGLLGWQPETCDCDKLQQLMENDEEYRIVLPWSKFPFYAKNIHFAGENNALPFQNTLRFRLNAGSEVLLEEEYYSIGGGFIQRKGEVEPPAPSVPYQYRNMTEFRKIIRKTGLPLTEVMMENEKAISGKSEEEILGGLKKIINIMCDSVESGLKRDGLLPGPVGLLRKAGKLYSNAQTCLNRSEKALAELNAFAMAASEENASGSRVVTAPTSGSAGVLPGIIYTLKNHINLPEKSLIDGMFAASLIAFIAKHNASIAGAEVGCQGEIGVASSMAAAFTAYARGCDMKRIENAAEIALEHHLGMTCDPVEGYVQVPCIERNAVGAVTAFNAYILASIGDPVRQKITFDEVVEAMLETGRDMCSKYRETARGGLAVCSICC